MKNKMEKILSEIQKNHDKELDITKSEKNSKTIDDVRKI